jgi:hypothetical protein
MKSKLYPSKKNARIEKQAHITVQIYSRYPQNLPRTPLLSSPAPSVRQLPSPKRPPAALPQVKHSPPFHGFSVEMLEENHGVFTPGE